MIELIIPGEPIAKKRPKFARRGKYTQAYNDQETEESKFIAQVQYQLNGSPPIEGPIFAKMFYYKSRPKGHMGTGRNAGKLKAWAPDYPTTKPDVDNYIKFTLDCLNEIAFLDDAQVVSVTALKGWAVDGPMTVIRLESVEC